MATLDSVHTLQSFSLGNSYIFRVSLAHHQGQQLHETIARTYYHLQYTEMW